MSKSAISLLQKHCNQKRITLPVYNIENHSLPSQPCFFKCTCLFSGKTTSAKSRSKKSAKELSAKLMLKELGIAEVPSSLSAQTRSVKGAKELPEVEASAPYGHFGNWVRGSAIKIAPPLPARLPAIPVVNGLPPPVRPPTASSVSSGILPLHGERKLSPAVRDPATASAVTGRLPSTVRAPTASVINGRPSASATGIKSWLPPSASDLSPDSLDKNMKMADNYVGELNEYCSQGCYLYPMYEEKGKLGECFSVECTYQTYTTNGLASTKKDAKQRAAYKMLQEIGLAPNFKAKTIVAAPPMNESTSISYAVAVASKNDEPNEALPTQPDIVLYRYCRENSLACPTYRFQERCMPPDNEVFLCHCKCNSKRAQATGPTKETAKQKVAALILKGINEPSEPNHVWLLNEFCVKWGVEKPVYSVVHREYEMILNNCFVHQCVCYGRTLEAAGQSQKAAKQNVAAKMLINLRDYEGESPKEPFQNYIGQLNEYCVKYDLDLPKYSQLYFNGGIIMLCNVELLTTKGVGRNKRHAKHQAARSMLRVIKRPVRTEYKEPEVTEHNDSKDKLVVKQNIECKVKSETEESKRKLGVVQDKACEELEHCKDEIENLYDISQIESMSDSDSDSFDEKIELIESNDFQSPSKKFKKE